MCSGETGKPNGLGDCFIMEAVIIDLAGIACRFPGEKTREIAGNGTSSSSSSSFVITRTLEVMTLETGCKKREAAGIIRRLNDHVIESNDDKWST